VSGRCASAECSSGTASIERFRRRSTNWTESCLALLAIRRMLLRAFTAIFEEGSSSTRRTLKAVLLHGFASGDAASGEDAGLDASRAGSGIYEVVDRHLTWQEAYSLVGGNPADYSARSRLCTALRAECQRQWEAVFGSAAPQVLSEEEAHV
jgi:hypothetical protein